MSNKRPSDADNDSPDEKKLKMEEEEDKRIAILQSYGTTVCHVPTDDLQQILALDAHDPKLHHKFQSLSIQVHSFQIEEPLVRFLGHWVWFRDAERAETATMSRQTERKAGVLDAHWLAFLIKALNTFDDPTFFTCLITDSLLGEFLQFLRCGGLRHIDQVYKTCRDSCKTQVLTEIFANVFIHENKQFAQQAPTCDYDRAVQNHMFAWLANVLVKNGDWNKLPLPLRKGLPTAHRCFHHTHGKDNDCYEDGKAFILNC